MFPPALINRILHRLKGDLEQTEMDIRFDRELRRFMKAEYGHADPAPGNYQKVRQSLRETHRHKHRNNRPWEGTSSRLSTLGSINVTFASGRVGSAATMLVTVILLFKVVTALGQQQQQPLDPNAASPTTAYTEGMWAHMAIKSSDSGIVPGAPHRIEQTKSYDPDGSIEVHESQDPGNDTPRRANEENGF